jgi:tetratricopeptide (TPR) repeat protein
MAGLDELRRRQLVDHAARASLHPLVRDHVYAGLAGHAGRRRALHRLAARASEWLADPLEASWHYTRAGDLAEAADLLVASVADLVASGRAERGADLVGELLGLADTETRSRLLVARGDLLMYTERGDDAERSYRDALAWQAPAAVRAGVTWRLAQCLLQRGQVAEALQLSEAAQESLTSDDDLLAAQLCVVRSQAHLMLSDFDAGYGVAGSALGYADRVAAIAAGTAAEIRCRALGVQGVVARLRGEATAAAALFDQSLANARATGRAGLIGRALFNYAALAHEQGELARAEALYTETLGVTRPVGDSYATARVLHALGMIRHQAGGADEAMARFTESIALRRRLGDIQGAANSEHSYAHVLLWLGRTAQAREMIDTAVTETSRTGERRSLGHLLDTLAMISLIEGDLARAYDYLTEAADIAAAIGERRLAEEVRLHRALAALADGDLGGARRLTAEPAGPAIGSTLLRLAVVACIALAAGDRAAALKHAADLSERAAAAGFVPEAGAARRIAACAACAASGNPPAAGYPRLIWVTDRTDRAVADRDPSLTVP